VTRALCWAHARRHFFVLADLATQAKRRPGSVIVLAPLAVEAVARIDRIFDIERAINGRPAPERLAVRRALAAPLVVDLEQWMRAQRTSMSRHAPVAKAMDYMLKDWPAFTRFLEDGVQRGRLRQSGDKRRTRCTPSADWSEAAVACRTGGCNARTLEGGERGDGTGLASKGLSRLGRDSTAR